jgi:hypothetical protein
VQGYKFAPGVEPNTFVFPTDSGWLYSVAFINNSYLFRGNTLLVNNNLTFEIVFGRSPLDKVAGRKDNLIALTLVAIVLKQFEVFGELSHYLIDGIRTVTLRVGN